MKRKLLFILLLVIALLTVLFTVSAGEKTFADMFPDATFRAYVTETILQGAIGVNRDNEIPTDAEMEQIQNRISINVEGCDISSLEGISYFTSLQYLNCSYNQLTALDVTKNTMLTELKCSDNHLSELDLTNNTDQMGVAYYET